MFPCSKKIKSLNAVTALCLKLCYDWIKFRLQHFGFASQETRSQETVSYYETQPSDVLHPCCWPVIYSLSCKGTKGRPFPSLYVVTSASVLWWILVHCVHLKEKKKKHFCRTSMILHNICFRRMCPLQAITSVLWALILEWWIHGMDAMSLVLARWFLILQERYVKRYLAC